MLAGRERALAEVDLEAIRHNVRRLMRDLPAAVERLKAGPPEETHVHD